MYGGVELFTIISLCVYPQTHLLSKMDQILHFLLRDLTSKYELEIFMRIIIYTKLTYQLTNLGGSHLANSTAYYSLNIRQY